MAARNALAIGWTALLILVVVSPSVAMGADTIFQQTDAGAEADWTAPRVDVDRLLAEDAANTDNGSPYRIGTALDAGLSPADSGSWQFENGRRVWRLVLRSPGAYWLLPDFDRVHLAPGAELWLYGPESNTRRGPFTEAHVVDDRMGFAPVEGETLVVEIDWPAGTPVSELEAHLARVFHGYRSLNAAAEGACSDQAGQCNVDINCSLGGAWQDEKRGIVKILIPDQAPSTNLVACSGSLINNTALDCKPYVLTADHCFTAASDVVNTSFIFHYERPGCGPGSASQAVFGTNAVYVARHPTTDFRLLRVGISFPTAGLYFNGWSRSPAPPPEAYTIHHPMGAPMKISRTGVTLAVGDGDPYPDGHWRVIRWAEGVTEPGSSGAPLFDPAGRIIGQLDSGSSGCDGSQPNTGGDNFGRLGVSWDIHPTLATLRLKDWLDPNGDDVVTLNGMDQSFCGDPQAKLVLSNQSVDENQGNRDGVLDPGDIAQVELQLTNVGPLAAGSTETGVTGRLSLADPLESQVTVLVDEARWPRMNSGMVADSAAPHFTIDVDGDRLCGKSIRFQIEAESDVSTFRVGTGAVISYLQPFEDDMEAGAGDWTASPVGSWSQTTSNAAPGGGITSWHVPEGSSISDSRLIMPSYGSLAELPDLAAYGGLPPRLELRFDHYMNSECGADGGVLEYSTDGSTWQDAGPLITEGGYNSVMLQGSGGALAGRPGWSGDLGAWATVRVDFSSFEGAEDLHLRWRFATDGLTGGGGWFVDNVALDAPLLGCARPHRRNVPGAFCRGQLEGGPWPPPLCGAGPGRSSYRR